MSTISPIRLTPVMPRPSQRPQTLSAPNQSGSAPLFGHTHACDKNCTHTHTPAPADPGSSAQAAAPVPETEQQPATKQQPAANKEPERKWYQKIGDWFKNLYQSIKDDLIALKDKIKGWFSKKPDKA